MKRRSIQASVLSFVLFSRKRERTCARKSIAFLIIIIIQRGKHHPSGFLFHRTRKFKRERYTRKTQEEEQEQLHHYLPNFDASLGNDVQANGLRNSGLGNREHYVYEFLSEYKVSTWVSFMARYLWFFFVFSAETAALLFGVFVSTEERSLIFEEQTRLLFWHVVAVLFFRIKTSSFLSFASLSVFCFFSFFSQRDEFLGEKSSTSSLYKARFSSERTLTRADAERTRTIRKEELFKCFFVFFLKVSLFFTELES